MMHGLGKSHSLIVPAKPPNEAGAEAKEAVEERRLAKGKTLKRNRFRTQSRQTCPARWSGYARARMGVSIATILIPLLHRRYHPRQEPDAAIPHVRIRAGVAREGDSYRDKFKSSR